MPYGDRLGDRVTPARFRGKVVSEIRRLTAPAAVKVAPLRGEHFRIWGEELPYFVHPYNTTWKNERAVEVAVSLAFLQTVSGLGLEFGNVLSHYGRRTADTVVDKYETAPEVVNADIVGYQPERLFEHIVSISTIEHVGWDERPRDAEKVLIAFDRLRSMLAPGGRMLITAALGHNRTLDEAVTNEHWPVSRQSTLVRDGHRWRETDEIVVLPYGMNGRGWANSVWIAELTQAT